jgi:hypothetical protein
MVINMNPLNKSLEAYNAFLVPVLAVITTLGALHPPQALATNCCDVMSQWIRDYLPNLLRQINLGHVPSDALIRIAECFYIEQKDELCQMSTEEIQTLSELWELFLSSIDQKLNGRSPGQALSTLPQIKDLLSRLNFFKQ